MPQVDHVKEEIEAITPTWVKIDDCLSGQDAIKAAGADYLPRPNPSDQSQENKTRYDQYKDRAVFYNVTARTLQGLVGQVFDKEAVVEIPSLLENLIDDIDGSGVSLEQQSKKALGKVLSFGRCGLLADHPDSGGEQTTREDLQTGKVRPSVILYAPEQVINWRTDSVGSQTKLTLVVLRETRTEVDPTDIFVEETKTVYRVLQLDPDFGIYFVEVYEDLGGGEWEVIESAFPLQSNGEPFQEIPFTFVGIENNDSVVDSPPLDDLANLNIAHYRNSADYEESSYIVGQPTPYFSGLTKDWVDTVMKGVVAFGSRGGIMLPEGGNAGLLQADPNIMPKEGMELKERQMVALGAKLVEQREVQRTLGEAEMENAGETSILGAAAKNVSQAYETALTWAGLFIGVTEEVTYQLSTDFQAFMLSAQDRTALIAEWQAGAIDYEELRLNLKRAGIASKDDEEVRENSEADTLSSAGEDPELDIGDVDPDPDANATEET